MPRHAAWTKTGGMQEVTKSQLIVSWPLAMFISTVLFYAGIFAPAKAASDLRQLERAAEDSPWRLDGAVERQKALQRDAIPNYYLGLAAPVAILGCCLVASMSKPGKREVARRGTVS